MKSPTPALVLLVLLALVVPVGTQSLADAAAAEAARRATAQKATQVITNKDLPDVGPPPSAGAVAADATPGASSASFAFDSIRAKCALDWAADFRMRVFCETQQREAVEKLLARNALMQTTPSLQAIRVKCLRDWSTRVTDRNGQPMFQVDFKMNNFCEEQQMKALGQLAR